MGNSLKSIFQRLASIKAGNLELIDEDGTVTTLSDVETVFNNIGIPLRNSINEFRNYSDKDKSFRNICGILKQTFEYFFN